MVVRNDAKVFFANEEARAEEVLNNDKTAGWGQDFIPRTPAGQAPKIESGRRQASSAVSAGTTRYPFDEVNAKSIINLDYFETDVLDINYAPVHDPTEFDVTVGGWENHYRLRFFSKYMVVFGVHGKADALRDYEPYDTTTHVTGVDHYVFESTHAGIATNPKLTLTKDGTDLELSLLITDLPAQNSLTLMGVMSTWFVESVDLTLTLNTNRTQATDRYSHMKVLIF